MKSLMLLGHGRAGKDLGCGILSELTGLANAGGTSKYLTKHVAAKLNRSHDPDQVYAERHANRKLWYDTGYELREQNPGIFVQESRANGYFANGLRDLAEVVYCRQNRIFDLTIWIQNNRVPIDPTVKFTADDCDLTIQNNGSIDEYRYRLLTLSRTLGFYTDPNICVSVCKIFPKREGDPYIIEHYVETQESKEVYDNSKLDALGLDAVVTDSKSSWFNRIGQLCDFDGERIQLKFPSRIEFGAPTKVWFIEENVRYPVEASGLHNYQRLVYKHGMGEWL